MTTECLFCEIIEGTLPSKKLHEDEKVIAFADIHPQAPLHLLIVPKKHIATMNDLTADDNEIIGHMFQAAKMLAESSGIKEEGYRVTMNCGKNGGQAVYHIHLHLLGGRQMDWPPG